MPSKRSTKPSSDFVLLAVTACTLLGVGAVIQEITFYTQPDQGGNALTLHAPLANFSGFEGVLRNAASYCQKGLWVAHRQVNFQGTSFGYYTGNYCGNTTSIRSYNSIRHCGPADTEVRAISLYEGRGIESPGAFGGEEHLVTGPASAFLPFEPKSYVTSGRSSWTFFSGSNFDGNSICIPAGPNDLKWDQYYGIVRSVVRGCGEEAISNIQAFLRQRT